ncbi:hypothetical protein BDEG_27754 [Batrachochytrium dendrobatidis JEL423]|uniref:Uncharacterized protein n=1 Tax=Batrachochytrium dendrobatidis (strain JEL423) TaxID=403673 RepID=A0A177WWR6_BATDL|nr:hypothetical protein BDEG_27754 [Batrachochytrium dendrobatidis JEL423]
MKNAACHAPKESRRNSHSLKSRIIGKYKPTYSRIWTCQSKAQVSAIRPVLGGNRDQEAANALHILVAHLAINNRTPYKLWYVSESVMAHLRPDGCQAHVLFPVSSLEKLTGMTNRVSQLEKTRSLSLKTLETGIPRRVQMDDRTRTVEPR